MLRVGTVGAVIAMTDGVVHGADPDELAPEVVCATLVQVAEESVSVSDRQKMQTSDLASIESGHGGPPLHE